MNKTDVIEKEFEKLLNKKYNQESFNLSYHILQTKFRFYKYISQNLFLLDELRIKNQTYEGSELSFFSGDNNSIADILSDWRSSYFLSDEKYNNIVKNVHKEVFNTFKRKTISDKALDIVLSNNIKKWVNDDYAINIKKFSEKDLEASIIKNINNFEKDFHIIAKQYPVEDGFIDILGKDIEGRYCIIEVKQDSNDKRVVFQSLYYPLEIARIFNTNNIRMIVIGEPLSQSVKKTLSTINVELYEYDKFKFVFKKINI